MFTPSIFAKYRFLSNFKKLANGLYPSGILFMSENPIFI